MIPAHPHKIPSRRAFCFPEIPTRKVVQMTPNDQKEKEVWEAEQASANLPMSGQDEDDIERMRKEFDEVFAF